MFDVLMLREIA